MTILIATMLNVNSNNSKNIALQCKKQFEIAILGSKRFFSLFLRLLCVFARHCAQY